MKQLEREAREIEGDSDNPLRVAIANDLYAKAAAGIMGAPSFTPGPWAAINDSDGFGWFIDTAPGVDSTNEYVIADEILGQDAEANACLIAAAPELYEACGLALEMLPQRGGIHSPTGRLRSRLTAALAKARGQQ
jgi:hypothetical protein